MAIYYNNGFNLLPTQSDNEQSIEAHGQDSAVLNYLLYARDWAYSQQQETMGRRRDFAIIKHLANSIEELWITPKPLIHRVGSGSKPFRLLGGQEVVLSEDDVRVEQLSKRYQLDQIFGYGIQYCINPVLDNLGKIDISKSSIYELLFLDDSNPIDWTLNLRQVRDNRNDGKIPLIP